MSIATGRDPQARDLLRSPSLSAQIVIPSICYMEALSALEDELKYRNRFTNELNIQIGQLRRDTTSLPAQALLTCLEQSLIENRDLLNDIQRRLSETFNELCTQAEMIELTSSIIQESLSTSLIEKEPTDNLILYCVLKHAQSNLDKTKAFLSNNYKEFNRLEVREALRSVGIQQYFRSAKDCIAWLGSQSDL